MIKTPRGDRRRRRADGIDADLRSAARRDHSSRAGAAAGRARRRRRRAGRARGDRRRGPEWGLSLATPVIVKYRDDARTRARSSKRGSADADPRSRASSSTSTRRPAARREAGAFLAAHAARVWATTSPNSRSLAIASTSSRRPAAPSVVFSTHFDCVPPFFPSRERAGHVCTAAARATPRARSSRRSRRPNGCARPVSAASGCCSSSAKSGAARARARPTPSRQDRRFLIDGEPTDNRLGTATRGVYRVKLTRVRPRRALEPARARRVGDREAPRRARRAAPRRVAVGSRRSGRTFYTVGLIDGGVAPNVIPAVGRRRGHVPHGRRPRGDPSRVGRDAIGNLVPIEDVLVVPPVRLTTVAGLRHGGLRVHDRHSRCSIAGARRCCSARARSPSRTPTTSTSRSPSCIGPSSSTRPWLEL